MQSVRQIRRRLGLRFPQIADAFRNINALMRADKSQFGEQELLLKYLPQRGLYLEIGAFQPILLSNTWMLSKRNWRGLSVDANCNLKYQWKLFRPRSTFEVMTVVPEGTGTVSFFALETGGAGMSSVIESHARAQASAHNMRVLESKVMSVSLKFLWMDFEERYGYAPTLLLLDVEGLDSQLAEALVTTVPSHLWPEYVLMELFDGLMPPEDFALQYTLIGHAGPSYLFHRRQQFPSENRLGAPPA